MFPRYLRTTRITTWRYHGSRGQAVFLAVLAALCWSSSGLFIKLIDWPALAILSGRAIPAALLTVWWMGYIPRRFGRWQILGAICQTLTMIFFISGNKVAPAANIIFLAYTSPIYIILLGPWLLKENPRRGDWIALPIILGGMVLFFVDDFSLEGAYGNLFGVLSGLTMAIYILAMRRQKQGNPIETIFLGTVLSILIGLPSLATADMTLPNMGGVVFLGIFQVGLGTLLFSAVIKVLDALEATLITTLEPILNPIWVFLAIGETPGLFAFSGAALVLAGVMTRGILSSREQSGTAGALVEEKAGRAD